MTERRPLPDGHGSVEDVPVRKTEWTLVALLFIAGVLLRCWQPSHLAVEHFDEGVYASNLYSPGGAYPFRHLYAPPLWPGLLEWALILSGGATASVMAVNLVAGSLMIPSLWWVGRQWFGPLAGIAAATLCALSQMHVLYSRTALTDVLLCLWMVWGVYWAWRAILTGRPAAVLLAAMFAGLAWWTKYNGWLTLAISGAGMAACLCADRLRSRIVDGRGAEANRARSDETTSISLGRSISRWGAIVTLVVVTAWLPMLAGLREHGGYAVVSANHAGYFVGVDGWFGGFLRQWENLAFIETAGTSNALGLLGLMLIATSCTLTVRRLAGAEILVIAALVLALNLASTPSVPSLLAVAGIGRQLMTLMVGNLDRGRRLALWMLAAWFLGLLVAVPLYTPYPRLTLPFLVAMWLGAGLGLSMLTGGRRGEAPALTDWITSRNWRRGLACVTFVAAVGILLWNDGAEFQDRRPLRTIAQRIDRTLAETDQAIVYVLGEPALFFHLSALSQNPNLYVLPGGDFESISPPDPSLGPVKIYTVAGPHVLRAPDDPAAGISWAEANLTPIDEWEYLPSTLVLLNEYAPHTLDAGSPERFVIRLGRIEN